ncbi:MAG TPA: efflux RND transporter periplasmic adaptor subunit [Gemmatales bacterium]|nr:efflux RND transporter periplasmic adaptor subunit [Gemmatales bacterium]
MVYRKRVNLLLLPAIVLAAALYWVTAGGSDNLAYRTEAITRGDITDIVSATGTLNPVHVVDVGTQVSGLITKLHVQVNDHVKAGQILAEIDPALLLAQIKQDRAALETARVVYEQAKRDLDRIQVLLSKDYVAKVDLERAQQSFLSARNQFDAAQTVVERDELNLSFATIVSPIDGVVIAQGVAEGQTLQASFQAPTMFRIAASLKEMMIEVGISEADISRIQVGLPVTFTVNAYPDRTFTGSVHSVSVSPLRQQSIVANAVVYAVTVMVDNSSRLLLPGMTAYVSIILSQSRDVLRAPLAALRFNPPNETVGGLRQLFYTSPTKGATRVETQDRNLKTIYVLREGRPVPTQVAVGAMDEAYVAISGRDIAEGDHVVTGILRPARR